MRDCTEPHAVSGKLRERREPVIGVSASASVLSGLAVCLRHGCCLVSDTALYSGCSSRITTALTLLWVCLLRCES